MATVAASMVLLRCVIHGSLSLNDVEVERRPYHRYCGCALHKVKDGSSCPETCPNNHKVYFPWKELSSDCLLSLSSSHTSARSSLLSVDSMSSLTRTEDTTGQASADR
ncbi:hypothetical protein ACJRO7_016643 [Eucalyptus globulus]|uniref:Uncharacterized protein n=1 Tax=Eucalyptus globulus TaxID=34317 RepID=A0ABD3LD93_EUCGL